jgi:hypothetical protein
MTEKHSGARVLAMRTPRTLMRDWCAATGDSWSDLNGRWRAYRDAGGGQKGAGRHTPPATEMEAGVMVLASLVAPLWKDVPAGIRLYSNLITAGFAYSPEFRIRFGEETCLALQAQFENRTLLDTLMICLRTFRSDTEIRFLSLGVEQSNYEPRASLHLGDPSSRTSSFGVSFAERGGPREGVHPEPRVHSTRMRGFALTAMADLLAPNLAAANRARSPAGTNETGPSVPPDEPAPSDNETPRGANPEATTNANQEASERDRKSQAGIESRGDSSGGASAATRKENPDDGDERLDRPSPCAA